MTVLIEDSPRNLAAWITSARAAGTARGGVVTPFATPRQTISGSGGCRGAEDVATMLKDAKAEVWFDATTHALQMAGVGDFRWYDDYDLWAGARGDLSTAVSREEHVRRVFELQDLLGALHLGPTILLHHGESAQSQQALDLAQAAIDRDPRCHLSIAGTGPFWSSASALDAHIGALAQLSPAGWSLSVVRPILALPVEVNAGEVEGLCRTTRALSEYAPVHVSHGDLAALPAIAAGASSVGSGWDQRQRVCAFGNYGARDPNAGGGGSWYERPTFRELLGSVTPGEAAVVERRDAALYSRLGPPPAPGAKEAYLHHLAVLNGAVAAIVGQVSYERRYRALGAMYVAARSEWPRIETLTSTRAGGSAWIDDLAAGLASYGIAEGW